MSVTQMSTSERPAFKTELQRIMREEGRTQRWLADKIGKHESQVSLWVNGLHCPDATKRLIAEALCRDVAEVFGEAA